MISCKAYFHASACLWADDTTCTKEDFKSWRNLLHAVLHHYPMKFCSEKPFSRSTFCCRSKGGGEDSSPFSGKRARTKVFYSFLIFLPRKPETCFKKGQRHLSSLGTEKPLKKPFSDGKMLILKILTSGHISLPVILSFIRVYCSHFSPSKKEKQQEIMVGFPFC